MFVEYYTQFFPFVYVKFIHTNINDDSFEYYKAEYLKILLRCKEEKQKIFLFYDLNVKEANGTIPLSYLPKQIEFNKKIFDLNEKYVKVVSVLSKDIHVRNVLKLSFGCIKNACPFKISSSFEKVSRYLKKNFNTDFDPLLFSSCNGYIQDTQEEKENSVTEEEESNSLLNEENDSAHTDINT